MSRSFTVRQLQPGDPFLADYRDMRIQLWPDCAEDCDREIIDILADLGRWAVFAASIEGRSAVGFLEVHLRDYAESALTSPVAFIEGWFVAAEQRRQGLGKALVRAAENWAISQGCTEIASDAQPDNTVSIAAHTQLGYREVERLVCFLKRIG